MKALITGGTGFVGRELVAQLRDPVVLSRDPTRAERSLGVTASEWKPLDGPPPREAFDGIDTVFHLAGEPVAGRWTRSKKHRIEASRVEGTRNLVDRIVSLPHPPETLISASAVGFYGSRGDAILDEGSDGSDCFLGRVCRAWEAEALRAARAGVRVVILRIGIVLDASGGALSPMLGLFKLGLGGRLGNGRQWMPWIHRADLVALMIHLARRPEVRGPVNAVAPNPVTNTRFTRALARSLSRPSLFPAPAFGLRLALGEFSTVLLASQRARPGVALNTGFEFRYPTLEPALQAILDGRAREERHEDLRAA